MKRMMMVGGLLAALASTAGTGHAQTYNFATSVGTYPPNVGSITLTQVSATSVNVFVDLLNGYGFVNTSGPYTPFAFTLAGSESGVSASFLTPVGGSFFLGAFSLSTDDGENTPFGTFGISINSSAPNGAQNAYFGDLSFNVTRATGLTTNDFIANAGGYYFSADLTNAAISGAQGWAVRSTSTTIPEPSTYALMGTGLLVIGGIAARRKRIA